jgi:hypothetical protein
MRPPSGAECFSTPCWGAPVLSDGGFGFQSAEVEARRLIPLRLVTMIGPPLIGGSLGSLSSTKRPNGIL